ARMAPYTIACSRPRTAMRRSIGLGVGVVWSMPAILARAGCSRGLCGSVDRVGWMTDHRTRRILRAFAAAAAIPALAGCAGPRSMLDPAGPSAQAIATIWWVMFWGAVVVWTLVVAFLLIALLRGENTRELARPQRLIVGGGLVLPT